MNALQKSIGMCLLLVAGIVNAKMITTAAENISIKNPHVVHMGSKKQSEVSVYMDVSNRSPQAYTVVAAYTPIARIAKLRTASKDKIKSSSVLFAKIPPKQTAIKKPAANFFVALSELKQDFKTGKSFPLWLIFNDGSSLRVNATAK